MQLARHNPGLEATGAAHLEHVAKYNRDSIAPGKRSSSGKGTKLFSQATRTLEGAHLIESIQGIERVILASGQVGQTCKASFAVDLLVEG